jgi:hypothetical protein
VNLVDNQCNEEKGREGVSPISDASVEVETGERRSHNKDNHVNITDVSKLITCTSLVRNMCVSEV